jgi:transposase-like protein
LAKRYDLSRNLIRIWVRKYEARIAALERLVGKEALELEILKGALKHTPRQRSAPASAIIGAVVSPSQKDAD